MYNLINILINIDRGVCIFVQNRIFLPPPPFSKNDIFSPKYSENFPFFPFYPPLPHYIWAKWKIYTPEYWSFIPYYFSACVRLGWSYHQEPVQGISISLLLSILLIYNFLIFRFLEEKKCFFCSVAGPHSVIFRYSDPDIRIKIFEKTHIFSLSKIFQNY